VLATEVVQRDRRGVTPVLASLRIRVGTWRELEIARGSTGYPRSCSKWRMRVPGVPRIRTWVLARVERDVKFEVDCERSAKAIDRQKLSRVQTEVERMISILDGSDKPGTWN
jgi:hypothetical protein